MATDVGGMPNGTYAHQGYAGMDQNSFAYSANTAASQAPAQHAPPTSSTPSNAQTAQQPPQSDISKDEVGWYFVEQYYTTLSRSPEKLYLFYNKRSQFVSGLETDKVPVCVGQRAINDKIRDLDFQDCKVRVTNVDSQSSDSNIVIQVIGEISNKGQPHRKFTQTFVLATQTNGYFVLNDIFRYLVDEEEDPVTETAQPAEDVQQVSGTESSHQEAAPAHETEPKTLTSSADPTAVEHDAKEVDKALEDKVINNHADEATPVVNGESTPAEITTAQEAPAPAESAAAAQTTENDRPSTADADADTQPEKPKDPEPTPVASPPKQAPPQPAPAAKPAAPAAPKTWATLAAAANRVATPVAPQPAAASTAATARPAATKPAAAPSTAAAASTPAPAAPSAPTAQRQDTPASDSQDEWTAVGGSHNRQQSRQANAPQPEQQQHRGYIKNVHESVVYEDLKAELEKFGEVAYFDIARQKNCAFVDFKTAEGYDQALNTPFELGGERMFVEERRIRPGSTPYVPRGQFQGGRGGRGGAGGQGAPRGNFQQGGNRGGNAPQRGRGNFAPRGGRGGAQA